MKVSLISDFNLDTLGLYLRKQLGEQAEVVVGPFGQFTQTVLQTDSSVWQPAPEACLIWTRPEAVLPSLKASLQGLSPQQSELDREVEALAELILRAAQQARFVFVASWTLPLRHAGSGLTDLSSPAGPARMVMAANLRLLQACEGAANVFVLDSSNWQQRAGAGASSPRHWYGAKVAFTNEVFKAAAQELVSAFDAIHGRGRKLILLDLDDTLWGGLVGEVGEEGIVLGGHDPVGEALVDFQQELKALSRRGVALGIVSKNTEALALEVIRDHPEMVLRPEDFAGWRINWSDKAENIADLTRELNLTLDSVVFIDDNPAERARLRSALPDVLVPEWPIDKRLYVQALQALDCFDKPVLTAEDQRRAEMYAQERSRSEIRLTAGSMDDWIAGLSMELTIAPLDRGNLARVVQLVNKTNQMNLSTRRLSEAEFWDWASSERRACWGFRLRDRFGDSGLTGVLSVEAEEDEVKIVDFILSCRVMGRRVERLMLQVAVEWAAKNGLKAVRALYRATEKNQPCLAFFRESGFREEPEGLFTRQTATPYEGSSLIRVIRLDDSQADQPIALSATHG